MSEIVAADISFVMPISAALDGSHVHFVQAGESVQACENGTATEPKAAPGNLCVYLGTAPYGLGGTIQMGVHVITNPATGSTGASRDGALLLLNGSAGLFNGTWAVTDATPAP